MRIIFPNLNLRIERWKWNSEYRVYVSSLGNFKDEYKNNMPFITTSTGYLNIKTPYGYKLAHRLVMLTFKKIPNAESLTIDHLNHNKRDNSLQNLEWVTREENLKRAEEDIVRISININGIPTFFGKKIIIDNKEFFSIEKAGNYVKQYIAKNPRMKNENAQHVVKNCIRTNKTYQGHTIKLV